MNKFRAFLNRFLIGRNGIDELYIFSVWLLLIVTLINRFVRLRSISIFCALLFILTVFRFLSRNLKARMQENDMFLKIWIPIKRWFIWQWDRLKDIKTFRYRKCPNCKAIIKLPNQRGKHTTTCPRCKHRFHVYIII